MTMHRCGPILIFGLWPIVLVAQDDAPLSAIDWLSQSVAETALAAAIPSVRDEPPVADSAETPTITVTTLDNPSPDGIGLLAPDLTGLPRSLWSGSPEAVLVTLVAAERTETLPALQDLIVTLMLAKADPPLGAGQNGALFLARVDKLLDLGALEPAQALLEQADLEVPDLFRRWFDVSLLTGTEDAACRMMMDRPSISVTYPARIFCLAREEDWSAAALTLGTARALGDVTAEEDALLSRFLDADLVDPMAPLPAPSRPSPLVFRMREAIGEALPTQGLPRAFAHADLRPSAAWRNQLEAAERLVRFGTVSENQLLGIYTAQVPAASGGVWDRARAIQRLEAALAGGDPTAIAVALPPALAAMQAARTEVAFARLYTRRLTGLTLPEPARSAALRLALLSPDYEQAGAAYPPTTPIESFWQSVARGQITGPIPDDRRAAAVAAAFQGAPVPEPMASQIADGQLGEALLRAVAAFQQGIDGDSAAVTDALAVFRAVGLEDVARRAALQYLILDTPG